MLIDLTKESEYYKTINFPDGQHDIVLTEIGINSILHNSQTVVYASSLYQPKPVRIHSRFTSWVDLEKICATVASIRNIGKPEIHLYIPYFLGARSDRKFVDGGNSYLKDVICPIINSLKLDRVTILDPHSDVLPALLNNCHVQSNKDWYDSFIYNLNPDILLYPDSSVGKRLLQYKLPYPVVTAGKHRDVSTGKISHTEIYGDVAGKNALVVDDICDGGRTFIELAKVAKERGCGKLYLAVTHGIFSQGVGELLQYFDKIYTTNSYSDHLFVDDNVKVYTVI